ncbi:MAG: hypothetical protein AAF378_16245 [Cyanobacteria bacterium P01_A01_bin.84]
MRNINPQKILEETFSSQLRNSSRTPHKWLKYYHQDYYQDTKNKEEQIYQHLETLAKTLKANEVIEYCRALFIEGKGDLEPEIISILDQILKSSKSDQEFHLFLNRCCQRLINFWYTQSHSHCGILQLVQLFDTIPTKKTIIGNRYKAIKKLRGLIKSFSQSQQYFSLYRLVEVMNQSQDLSIYLNISENNISENNQTIAAIIKRYPYLYEHCLASEDSPLEHKQTALALQAKVQRRLEISLSKYTIYRVRYSQILASNPEAPVDKILQTVENPTLLSDRNLNTTLDRLISRAEGDYNYRGLAKNFSDFSLHSSCFAAFKDDLYEYLITSIDWEYGKYQFHNKLYQYLSNILPQANHEKLNEFLLIRTANNLLGFLIVENNQSPQHSVLFDLITNQGTLPTIGILLKILLICPKIKPHFTKRIAILFQHYQTSDINEVKWFIQFLEQLNIALTIYFGKVDLSYFKQISYLKN